MKINLDKLIIPLSIIVGCIIIGGFYYASQLSKQDSIERQQQAELQEARARQTAENETKQKEYLAQRKNDCLDIHKAESDKWNNVTGWRFDESDETCYIRYKDNSPKTDAECDGKFKTDGEFGFVFIRDNLLCKGGEFENSF